MISSILNISFRTIDGTLTVIIILGVGLRVMLMKVYPSFLKAPGREPYHQMILIKNCRLFDAKFSFFIYIKYICIGLVGFYSISTTVGYLMPNPIYTYILRYACFGLVEFYGISTIGGYLMPNPLYLYIYQIYLVWFGWVLWHINHCKLFNAKSCLYMYI